MPRFMRDGTRSNQLFCSAVNEDTTGKVQSFLVGSNGSLANFGNASSGGNGPAFAIPLSTGEVAAMNVSSL